MLTPGSPGPFTDVICVVVLIKCTHACVGCVLWAVLIFGIPVSNGTTFLCRVAQCQAAVG